MSHATCPDCHALSFYYGHRAGCPREAMEAMLAEPLPIPRTPLQEYIAKIERAILDSAAVPNFVLIGTPSASGMYFDGQPLWRNEFMGQWHISGTALEAEERRQRRNDHVDAIKHALTGRQSGKPEALERHLVEQRAQGNDVVVIHGHDRGMPIYDFPCSCGRTIRGTDRDRGKRCEHTEESGIWCAANGTWACARTDSHIRAMCHDGRANDIPKWISDAHPSPFCPVQPAEPKPPTLREWLGPRVADLGPWAEVLREQPAPAGQIVAWEWYQSETILPSVWMLRATERSGAQVFGPADMVDFLLRWEDFDGDCLRESLQMALFTRHPSVKPEPRLTIGCEDQYEL